MTLRVRIDDDELAANNLTAQDLRDAMLKVIDWDYDPARQCLYIDLEIQKKKVTPPLSGYKYGGML